MLFSIYISVGGGPEISFKQNVDILENDSNFAILDKLMKLKILVNNDCNIINNNSEIIIDYNSFLIILRRNKKFIIN